jgi:excisionase family DNA binding protein
VAAESEREANVAPFRRSNRRLPPEETHRQNIGRRSEEPPLTLVEAARFLNVSERWMRRAVAQRSIPFVKLGRQLRFLPEDLRSILEAGRIEPVPRPRGQ